MSSNLTEEAKKLRISENPSAFPFVHRLREDSLTAGQSHAAKPTQLAKPNPGTAKKNQPGRKKNRFVLTLVTN